jgi:hypothetical protein
MSHLIFESHGRPVLDPSAVPALARLVIAASARVRGVRDAEHERMLHHNLRHGVEHLDDVGAMGQVGNHHQPDVTALVPDHRAASHQQELHCA